MEKNESDRIHRKIERKTDIGIEIVNAIENTVLVLVVVIEKIVDETTKTKIVHDEMRKRKRKQLIKTKIPNRPPPISLSIVSPPVVPPPHTDATKTVVKVAIVPAPEVVVAIGNDVIAVGVVLGQGRGIVRVVIVLVPLLVHHVRKINYLMHPLFNRH